jgi:glycosyltransferase involved in cell wall biosynthesis
MKKKRILALTSRAPYPVVSGGQARMYHLLRELACDFDIDLISIHNGEVSASARKHLESVLHRVHFVQNSKLRSAVNAIVGAAFQGKPLQVGYYYRGAVRRWIVENQQHYDAVLCFHVRTAEYVRGLPCVTVIDLVDAISLGYARALEKGSSWLWHAIYKFELPRLIKYEQEVIAESALSVVVSAIDREFLIKQGGECTQIEVVPHGTEILEPPSSPLDPSINIDLLFHGKLDYPPNEAACLYLVNNIFPLLSKHRPLNLYLVGYAPTGRIRRLADGKQIVVTGFVENIAAYLARAKVVVAPLTYGSGVKTKVLEAMGMGKAVVTTSVGADGISGRNGVHFFVADDPGEFAACVLTLLDNDTLRETMGAKAKELIRQEYTWKGSGEMLRNLLEQAIATKRRA